MNNHSSGKSTETDDPNWRISITVPVNEFAWYELERIDGGTFSLFDDHSNMNCVHHQNLSGLELPSEYNPKIHFVHSLRIRKDSGTLKSVRIASRFHHDGSGGELIVTVFDMDSQRIIKKTKTGSTQVSDITGTD